MPALPVRKLGRNGPEVTAEGWGAMGLSAFYGKVGSDEERFEVIDKVYSLGCRFWDSADIYGDSEELLGKWFQRTGKRSDIFLATKFAVEQLPDGNRRYNNTPEYIRAAVDKSLKRLQTDVIDLYYCHRLSGEVPVETVVSTMAELVKAGKVRHIGLSECSAESLRRAHQVHPIAAVQIEYSPWTRDIELERYGLKAACEELGVAIVAYSPLGRGMLTGAIRSRDDLAEGDFRRSNPRFSEDNFPKNLAIVDTLRDLAAKRDVTPGQLTLAWLMRQSDLVIPIPGTTKVKNLEENLAALKLKLTNEEDSEIRKAIENADVAGDRYPESGQKLLFMDTPPLK